MKNINAFDLSSFNDRRYFHDDGSQIYKVFLPLFKSFTTPTDIGNPNF